MKKITAFLLALLMVCALISCSVQTPPADSGETPSQGQNDENQNDNNDSNNTSNTDNNTDSNTDSNTDNNTDSNTNNEEKTEFSFEAVTVVDNSECTIKITKVNYDGWMGFSLKANLENKSAEKTYMFSVESAAINGVECIPIFATEVAAGKKANGDIYFADDELEENGVGDYTDVELTFRVYDSNDWLAEEVAIQTVHIYPLGENKAVKYHREPKTTDKVIIDNEHLTVTVIGYEKDDILGYSAKLYLVNKSDKNIMFSADEVSVNGYMIDPFFATSVLAGKCAFASITWFESALEENEISNVEEIEFKLRAYDNDNWFGDDFANVPVVLNP